MEKIDVVGDVMEGNTTITPKEDFVAEFEKGTNMLTDDFLADGIPGSIGSERMNLYMKK